jgi:hypothetical protein
MLLPFEQQGTAPLLQALRPVSHEYLGTRPQAIRDAATTPKGWKIESQARRNRRLLGRNSSVMVASIGMLPASKAEARWGGCQLRQEPMVGGRSQAKKMDRPPTPNPIQAVTKHKAE